MENVLALIAATLILVMLPGPNVALIVAGSLRHGRRYGVVTVAGTTTGIAIQLVLVVAGYSALIAAIAGALVWIKWLGVAALVYLGIRAWRAADGAAVDAPPPEPLARAFRSGLLLAVVNPKTLLFNAAFLPQFVGSAADAGWQLAVLAGVYLLVIAVGDCGWVLFATVARRLLLRIGRWQQRLAAGFLLAAGGALALTRVER